MRAWLHKSLKRSAVTWRSFTSSFHLGLLSLQIWKAPSCHQRLVRVWVVEKQLAHFYMQSFFDSFGQLPIVPHLIPNPPPLLSSVLRVIDFSSMILILFTFFFLTSLQPCQLYSLSHWNHFLSPCTVSHWFKLYFQGQPSFQSWLSYRYHQRWFDVMHWSDLDLVLRLPAVWCCGFVSELVRSFSLGLSLLIHCARFNEYVVPLPIPVHKAPSIFTVKTGSSQPSEGHWIKGDQCQ